MAAVVKPNVNFDNSSIRHHLTALLRACVVMSVLFKKFTK